MARRHSSEPLPTHPCSNPDCTSVVQPRKKSQTGDHWCQKPDCQAMKQRQYRAARRSAAMEKVTQEDERLTLFRVALHAPRVSCPKCDLEDGVRGFMHRAAPGSRQICDGLGGGGRAAGKLWLDAIHPDRMNP